MRIRFYAALLLGLLATGLGLADLFLFQPTHVFRASLGVLLGGVVIVIAIMVSGSQKTNGAPRREGRADER